MVNTKDPRVLWDDCIELQAYVQSHMAHPIFELHRQVPETIVLGETAHITPFCSFSWYQWVKFHDNSISFPNEPFVLGWYLSPIVDVGPALTAKILKQNGQVMYRTTYHSLTPQEIISKVEVKVCDAFDTEVVKRLGSQSQRVTWETWGQRCPHTHCMRMMSMGTWTNP